MDKIKAWKKIVIGVVGLGLAAYLIGKGCDNKKAAGQADNSDAIEQVVEKEYKKPERVESAKYRKLIAINKPMKYPANYPALQRLQAMIWQDENQDAFAVLNCIYQHYPNMEVKMLVNPEGEEFYLIFEDAENKRFVFRSENDEFTREPFYTGPLLYSGYKHFIEQNELFDIDDPEETADVAYHYSTNIPIENSTDISKCIQESDAHYYVANELSRKLDDIIYTLLSSTDSAGKTAVIGEEIELAKRVMQHCNAYLEEHSDDTLDNQMKKSCYNKRAWANVVLGNNLDAAQDFALFGDYFSASFYAMKAKAYDAAVDFTFMDIEKEEEIEHYAYDFYDIIEKSPRMLEKIHHEINTRFGDGALGRFEKMMEKYQRMLN